MPDHLTNLTPPTRADAERVRRYHASPPPPDRFEDTAIGKRVAAGTNGYGNPEVAREARRKWEEQREAAITNTLMTLQREYEENVAAHDRIAATNAKAFEIEKQELRASYLNQPGATEADFEKALPALLEARRQQAVLNASADWERQKAEFRSRSGI